MTYTDLTSSFAYKDPVYWNLLDALAENDAAMLLNQAGYRRPNIVYVSGDAVDIENNTGTANQTKIVFPDGDTRSVTENTSSLDKYRRLKISATANFTSGTEDSGLRSGLTEGILVTWYAIYAVKSQIDSTKFVLVADTNLPIQANFSTNNSNFGSNSWVYLGLVFNGIPRTWGAVLFDIYPFKQANGFTLITDSDANSPALPGIQVASGSSPSAMTFSVSRGVGPLKVPNNIGILLFGYQLSPPASLTNDLTTVTVTDSAGAVTFHKRKVDVSSSNQAMTRFFKVAADLGIRVTTNHTTGTSDIEILSIAGWMDSILAGNCNPVL